ncbi:hypothetical protein ASPVEDRAFT_57821 [Aspergillus versicolor CBS 583.65]|uniref:Uncharacterized protein n=1 Tax=Aspergillus versicolor CBS 583.65 TaxID=1036611 RepID=A0A1L9Q528_ASPVE|nr:uncharacterized protein ASPVEDRAFT_57821 [Aspergillus versicolor CBS 583.65]OJJ08849.1 hypothetical protein ASPVEDRAFT_57821 [Aspergillus versicolor CBS 583.65]
MPEPLYDDIYSYRIYNQSALDTLASECTSINASVAIEYNYTGSFYLPNIQSITGDLSLYPDAISHNESISLPDLETIGGRLQLSFPHYFRTISAPKLSAVEGYYVSIQYARDVDLRALRSAKEVNINGNLSSIRLESLEEVRDLDIYPESASPSPIDIFLLSLKSAASIVLRGKIASISLPKLTSLGPNRFSIDPDPASFELTTEGGPPLNVSFPELDTVHDAMKLEGSIGSLSMPKIIDTNMTLTLVLAHYLTVVFSVNLPNLRRAADGIYIYSDVPLDCDKVESEIFRNVSISNGSRTCRVPEEEPKPQGLSTNEKIGIGLGCGIGGLIVFILIPAYLLHRGKKRNERFKRDQEVELTPPTYQAAQQERPSPPEYSAGDNGHVASPRETS